MKRISLMPGEQGKASWVYSIDQIGKWDVVYGAWGFWEEGKEPQSRINTTGWFNDYITAYEHCSGSSSASMLARIDTHRPFQLIEVLAGDSVTLGMEFTNTGDKVRKFVAGVTVLDSDKNVIVDYDQLFDKNLLPDERATAS